MLWTREMKGGPSESERDNWEEEEDMEVEVIEKDGAWLLEEWKREKVTTRER